MELMSVLTWLCTEAAKSIMEKLIKDKSVSLENRIYKKIYKGDFENFLENHHVQKAVKESLYKSIIDVIEYYKVRSKDRNIKREFSIEDNDFTMEKFKKFLKALKFRLHNLEKNKDNVEIPVNYEDVKRLIASHNDKKAMMKKDIICAAENLEVEIMEEKINSLVYREIINNSLYELVQKHFIDILKKNHNVSVMLTTQLLADLKLDMESLPAILEQIIEDYNVQLKANMNQISRTVKDTNSVVHESKAILEENNQILKGIFNLDKRRSDYANLLLKIRERLEPQERILSEISQTIKQYETEYNEIQVMIKNGWKKDEMDSVNEELNHIGQDLKALVAIAFKKPDIRKQEELHKKFRLQLEELLENFIRDFSMESVISQLKNKDTKRMLEDLEFMGYPFNKVSFANLNSIINENFQQNPKGNMPKELPNNSYSNIEILVEWNTRINSILGPVKTSMEQIDNVLHVLRNS